ncbi:hypothetical protein [Flavobacterium sp.]|uniref:hypothetical protein n=1 Tax=Flavobacterium sp. TaxID=239 RepID=UPI00334230C4
MNRQHTPNLELQINFVKFIFLVPEIDPVTPTLFVTAMGLSTLILHFTTTP